MNIIRGAVQRPVAVISAVMLIVLLGLISLARIPIQLVPDVSKPVLTIRTGWSGAAPLEIEREIMIRQEEALKGLEGLQSIEGSASAGRSSLTLEFPVGQDMNKATLLVSNRLDGIDGYPAEAGVPRISTRGSEDSPIAWFSLRRLPGNRRPIHEYGDFLDDVVRDRLERVSGVGGVNIYGETKRELQIIFRPEQLARYRLTVGEIIDRLRRADLSVTAGEINEGKRRYTVRAESPLDSPESVRLVVLRALSSDTDSGLVSRVTIADIADVRWGFRDPTASIRHMGRAALALNVQRETGSNVIEIMAELRAAVAELEAGPLREAGLSIEQVYDETRYINSAIDLVQQNIWIGGLLASLIILIFLRTWRATLIIIVTIPISVIGAFVALAIFGRSINVISLAGMAFAVGMVADAAIVVLENIFRLRESGLPMHRAAIQGAKEVWGAILASVLTTVLVFAPILVMELEVGQLFRDIAVSVSVSVGVSLIVAVTLIPALTSRLLGPIGSARTKSARWVRVLAGCVSPIGRMFDAVGHAFVFVLNRFLRFSLYSWHRSLLVVVVVAGSSAGVAWWLTPPLEYLPEGNRNLVFGFILPPPGYNLATMTGIAQTVENAARPLWEAKHESEIGGAPIVDRFFFVALKDRAFVGAATIDPARVAEIIPIIRSPVFKEPGTFALFRQYSLFGRGLGGTRNIQLDISGPSLPDILRVAAQLSGRVFAVFPREEGNQFRPIPGLELGSPELRVVPDRRRLADAGVDPRELGLIIDAFNDGVRVSEITIGGRRVDLMLRGVSNGTAREQKNTQSLGKLPILTRNGAIVPLASLASVDIVSGPTEIRHIERLRTVTLQITPAPDIALETAIDRLRRDVIAPERAAGLPPGVVMRVSGTADQLAITWQSIAWDLALAVVIVYLVMAVLFESFVYPLVIMISVPPAAAGGVLGLKLLNLLVRQELDMLTLLGGIILVGIVVNNAILLVDRSLSLIRHEGMSPNAALRRATNDRVRPIFMSTLTSVFGMLPLVVFPGAGSELYRGLGSVVCGGLALSALLTLLIVPPLMALAVKLRPVLSVAVINPVR